MFETTIRVLGGLLSMHALTNNAMFMKKVRAAARRPANSQCAQAAVLGDKLLGAFTTGSHIPVSDVNLLHGRGKQIAPLSRCPSLSTTAIARSQGARLVCLRSTAEVTSIQLEFKYLSHVTGDPVRAHLLCGRTQAIRSETRAQRYRDAAERVMDVFAKLPKFDGLVPIYISPDSGNFGGHEIRLGSRGDSYYEYLLKQARKPRPGSRSIDCWLCCALRA